MNKNVFNDVSNLFNSEHFRRSSGRLFQSTAATMGVGGGGQGAIAPPPPFGQKIKEIRAKSKENSGKLNHEQGMVGYSSLMSFFRYRPVKNK